jgi:hypothetical protein
MTSKTSFVQLLDILFCFRPDNPLWGCVFLPDEIGLPISHGAIAIVYESRRHTFLRSVAQNLIIGFIQFANLVLQASLCKIYDL